MQQREIKFRAQRLGSKEWVYGDLLKHSTLDPFTYIAIGTGYKIDNPDLGKPIKVYPHTVGQFTGLHDKNGKEIYEGDLLRSAETGNIFTVEWVERSAAFKIREHHNGKRWMFGYDASRKFDVIGNIYENPELLK